MPPALSSSIPDLNIAVGAYDATVVGLHLSTDADDLLELEARFAYTPHASSVRDVAIYGSMVASASADETVRVYDVARRTETAALTHHSGSVNAVSIFKDPVLKAPLLLSASSDNTVGITRLSDLRLLKKLSAHTAPVTAAAVHPSARVMLTLAADRSVFMWNLLRGKVAFSAKTKPGPASSVSWSPSGERYLLTSGNIAALYSAEGSLESTLAVEGALLSAVFMDDGRVVTGGEDCTVRVWDARSGKVAATPAKHELRVRGVATAPGVVISADTAGGVKIWDEKRGGSPRLETELGGGGMRVTSLAVGTSVLCETQYDIGKAAKNNASTRKRTSKRQKQDRVDAAPKTGTASSRKRQKRKASSNEKL